MDTIFMMAMILEAFKKSDMLLAVEACIGSYVEG